MWSKTGAFCFTLIWSVVLFSACKTKKATTQPVEPAKVAVNENSAIETLLKSIELNRNDYNYINNRGKLKYDDGEQKADLDVVITLEKDKYIFMSVSAVLGLNVARVLATPDSLVILDLLHRKAIITNYDYLKRMSNVALTFTQLQNLIIGNAPFNHDLQTTITDTVLQQLFITQALPSNQTQSVGYELKSLRAQQTKVAERGGTKEFTINYYEAVYHKGYAYPSHININIRAEKNVKCEFELSNFVFEKKKDIVFSIPKTFTIVRP